GEEGAYAAHPQVHAPRRERLEEGRRPGERGFIGSGRTGEELLRRHTRYGQPVLAVALPLRGQLPQAATLYRTLNRVLKWCGMYRGVANGGDEAVGLEQHLVELPFHIRIGHHGSSAPDAGAYRSRTPHGSVSVYSHRCSSQRERERDKRRGSPWGP